MSHPHQIKRLLLKAAFIHTFISLTIVMMMMILTPSEIVNTCPCQLTGQAIFWSVPPPVSQHMSQLSFSVEILLFLYFHCDTLMKNNHISHVFVVCDCGRILQIEKNAFVLLNCLVVFSVGECFDVWAHFQDKCRLASVVD